MLPYSVGVIPHSTTAPGAPMRPSASVFKVTVTAPALPARIRIDSLAAISIAAPDSWMVP